MSTGKEVNENIEYGDPESMAKLSLLTKGKILEIRKDIPKSLILTALDNFENGSTITPENISEKIYSITKCTIPKSEIISIFTKLENENIIEHKGNLNYKVKKKPHLSNFETLTQPVWKEFEEFIKSHSKEYDSGIHSNAKKVFDSLLLKIIVRFVISKPLENKVDEIPLDNFDEIVSQEVKENYFPGSFASAYSKIIMEYFSSESPQLLDFIFNSYCGLINIDIVLKEQKIPSVEFGHEIDFLLLDSNFIIPLLCSTDLKNPLSIALINLCNKYGVKLYYTGQTKSEIWNSINNARKTMNPINSDSKFYRTENQFVDDYSRRKGTWTDYYLLISQWEESIRSKWNIELLPPLFSKEIEEVCYEFVSRMLQIADEFRYSRREEKNVDYNIRLRADKSYEHDAYCISLISYLRKNPINKNTKRVLGPWFLTYDDLISFVNQTQLRKNDNIGYSIHPRILLNYFLAYSRLEFDNKDKEHVAMALLKYTARPNTSSITVDEYSRIFAEQIDIGSENANVLKNIFVLSPLIDKLDNALSSGNRDEAYVVAADIFSDINIKDIVEEAIYSTKEKKEHQETIKRLQNVVVKQQEMGKKTESVNKMIVKAEDNSRINIGSIDKSKNKISINQENVFFELKNVIEKEIEDSKDREELLKKIEEMENLQGTKDFNEKYTSFVQSAADYMTILAPFIPTLSNFIS